MKILAISDEVVEFIYSPRVKDQYADVDLVLGCGDLPFYYLEFIVTVLNVPLYYVPGNHDRLAQYHADGRVVHSAEGCEPLDATTACFPNRLYPAASPEVTSGLTPGLLLAGLGGSMRYNQDNVHQYNEAEMLGRVLSLAPRLLANRLRYGRALDILFTHAPPRGIHDADDLAHTGFEAFLTFMDVFRPRLLVHGHSHVYRNDAVTTTRYKDTLVLNVYPYRLIEWPAVLDAA
jgi:predicted phosphodiesterase